MFLYTHLLTKQSVPGRLLIQKFQTHQLELSHPFKTFCLYDLFHCSCTIYNKINISKPLKIHCHYLPLGLISSNFSDSCHKIAISAFVSEELIN